MNRKEQTIFSNLYQEHAPYLYGVCLRYAKNKEDAEDVMQEGFVNIYKGLKDFKKEANIKTWMVRIMINTSIKYYRQKSVLAFSIDDYEDRNQIIGRGFDDNAIDQLQTKELLEVLNELPNGYRIVFNLFCIEGYKHREIAEMLDISEGTSKSQLTKAKLAAQKLIIRKLGISY